MRGGTSESWERETEEGNRLKRSLLLFDEVIRAHWGASAQMLMSSKLINTFIFEPEIRKCSSATDTSPYLHLSVHVHSGGRSAAISLESQPDERLTVNRLLFSLNSCLSTSLIKTRGRLRKNQTSQWNHISSHLLQPERDRQFPPSPKGGDIQQHNCTFIRARTSMCLCTLDFHPRFVNQKQLGWICCHCRGIPVIELAGAPAQLALLWLWGWKKSASFIDFETAENLWHGFGIKW